MEENNNLQNQVRIKDFQTPADRVTSGYVNALGIYLLAKESMDSVFNLGNPSIEFSDRNLEFHLRNCCIECPDTRNPCQKRELDELSRGALRIFWPIGTCDEYCFSEESASREFDDRGGENVVHSFLLENRIPILMSAQYLAYEVDHSGDDYPTSVIRRTELLTDTSGIAKYIFQHIKDKKINHDALIGVPA